MHPGGDPRARLLSVAWPAPLRGRTPAALSVRGPLPPVCLLPLTARPPLPPPSAGCGPWAPSARGLVPFRRTCLLRTHLWPCRRCGPQEEGGVKGGSGLGESIIRESVPGDPPPAFFWPSHTNSKHVYYVSPAALVHLSHRPREWRCGVLWGPLQWGLSAPANLHAESEREGHRKAR